jgi:hypothetical protein
LDAIIHMEDNGRSLNQEGREWMVRYLLGELQDEEEKARFEQRLLADEKLYEELLIAEDELMEAYLSGELSAGDKARFEEHFLGSPRCRERVENLRALREVLRRRPSSPIRLRLWPALAAASLAVVFAAAWVYEHTVVKRLEGELAVERVRRALSGPPSIHFVLTPGLTRSDSGTQWLIVPATASEVRLQIDLPKGDPRPPYRAVLETSDGRQVWSQDLTEPRLTPTGHAVDLIIPAGVFERGDYLMFLRRPIPAGEWQNAASYSFRVALR